MENQEELLESSNPSEELDYENDYDVADKISSLLSGEPETVVEETVEELATAPEPQPIINDDYKVKVKVNGIEQEVSLSELRNGYQRQSDYTAKTQELSQQRTEVEHQKQQYNQYVQSIPMLALVAQQNVNSAQEKLYSSEMLQLAQTDPAEYISQKAQIEKTIIENQRAFQQMQHQYGEYQTQVNSFQNQQVQQLVQQSNDILEKELDGWKDGTVKQALREYALKNKFSENDLNSLYDHRQVSILNKARLYDELMANQNVAQKRVEKVPPKVISPSSNANQDTSYEQRRSKALASGNADDIARLISELM